MKSFLNELKIKRTITRNGYNMFKIGDKVILLTDEEPMQSRTNWAKIEGLSKGQAFIIDDIDERGGWIKLKGTQHGYYHPPEKFRLARQRKDPHPDWW
jgi:hypothetical protein